METKQVKLRLKEVSDEGYFVGLSSVYGNRDLGGDVMVPGAFTKTIQENGGRFPLLYGHKINIGVSMVEDTKEGLQVKGLFNLDVQTARDVHSHIKFYKQHGLDFGMSIGYLPIPDKVEVKSGARHLKEVMLFENTLTEIPMNVKARVQDVKTLAAQLKASDFLSELDVVDTWAKRYQMLDALDSAIYSIIWDDNLTSEQKVAAAEDTVGQFHAAFMGYLPRLVSLIDTRYKDALDQFEKKTASALTESRSAHVKAAATSLRALLSGGAAQESKEPALDHSALSSQIDELKGLFTCH